MFDRMLALDWLRRTLWLANPKLKMEIGEAPDAELPDEFENEPDAAENGNETSKTDILPQNASN